MKFIFALLLVLAFMGFISWILGMVFNWAINNKNKSWFAKILFLLGSIGMLVLTGLIIFFWIGGLVTSCSPKGATVLPDNCYADHDRQGSYVICE